MSAKPHVRLQAKIPMKLSQPIQMKMTSYDAHFIAESSIKRIDNQSVFTSSKGLVENNQSNVFESQSMRKLVSKAAFIEK